MKRLRDKIVQRLNLSLDLNGETIFEFAKKNMDKIDDLIEEFADNLGEGITNIVNIFEPEAICIGGSYVYHLDVLGEKVKKVLDRAKTYNGEMPQIVLAQYHNTAGIIGATLL